MTTIAMTKRHLRHCMSRNEVNSMIGANLSERMSVAAEIFRGGRYLVTPRAHNAIPVTDDSDAECDERTGSGQNNCRRWYHLKPQCRVVMNICGASPSNAQQKRKEVRVVRMLERPRRGQPTVT
ncbi:MAG: hypothetical protein WCB92_16965 [Mycobacterium sp.]